MSDTNFDKLFNSALAKEQVKQKMKQQEKRTQEQKRLEREQIKAEERYNNTQQFKQLLECSEKSVTDLLATTPKLDRLVRKVLRTKHGYEYASSGHFSMWYRGMIICSIDHHDKLLLIGNIKGDKRYYSLGIHQVRPSRPNGVRMRAPSWDTYKYAEKEWLCEALELLSNPETAIPFLLERIARYIDITK